jgi:hypothetical protein
MKVHDVKAFLAWLPGVLSAPGIRCVGVGFEGDGCVRLRYSATGAPLDVFWGAPRRGTAAIAGLPYRFAIRGAHDSRTSSRVRSLLRERLADVLETYRPAVLEYANRNLKEVVFERGIATRLFGAFLEPGGTVFGHLRCEAWTFDGEAEVVTFGGRLGTVEYRLTPAALAPGACPGRLVAGNRAFSLRRGSANDGPCATDRRGLERYLAYVLNRCTRDGMTVRVYQDSVPLGSTFLWGNDLRFQFFCEKEHDCISLMNAMCGAGGRVGIVGHFDRECLNQFAFTPRRIQSMTVSRWYAPAGGPMLDGLNLTDLDDRASIMGSGRAVDRVLRSKAAADLRDFAFVWHSCLPLMTGDSLQPAVSGAGRRHGVSARKHIICEMDVENLYTHLQQFWSALFMSAKLEWDGSHAGSPSVNLVGYGRRGDSDLEELVLRAAEAGIRVIARLVPSFSFEEARRAFGAARGVMLFDELTVRAVAKAKGLLDLPLHTITGPFGIEGTKAWLLSLAALFGKETRAASVWRRWHAQHAREIADVRARAATHRVAVALGREQIPRVLNPYFNYGIPLLPLLEEMGFGLDIFVYDRNTSRDNPVTQLPGDELAGVETDLDYPYLDPPLSADPAEVGRVLRDPARHEIRTYGSFEDLLELLNASRGALLYSEIYRDRRAICTGKIPIDLAVFELGLGGMARAGRRLVALCETPYYRVHSRRLGGP